MSATAVKDSKKSARRKWWQCLGPGLITGASDDDPSGIATYAQVGAMFRFAMLWTMLFAWPLMAATQEISARIGRISGRGLAANMSRVYSRWVTTPIIFLLIIANVVNLGADIAAMGEAARLMFHGGSPLIYSLLFVVISLLLEIFVRYARYSQYLKWLSLSLAIYVGTAFLTPVPWKEVLRATFVPHMQGSASFLAMLIAVLGTTISPYLFFWQSSMETEEIKASAEKENLKKKPEQAPEEFLRIRLDTDIGMGISNLIAFFIILTMAVTVGSAAGKHGINTAAEAADALGKALGTSRQGWVATWFFSLGIIGTGLLAMPVLAGSAAYAVCEAVKWRTGLDEKWPRARGFYGTLIVATLLALAMNLAPGISPMKALVWAAVVNGVVAVPVMAIMMKMSSDKRVVGQFAGEGKTLRAVGWIATGVMALATAGMFATLGR